MDNLTQNTLLRWWQGMSLPPGELKKLSIMPAPSGQKAILKRCKTADAAMLTEGFRNLWLKLDVELPQSVQSNDIECWATIAAALVYVKTDNNRKLAVVAGEKGNGDKSKVSELRFSQLQNAKTSEEFLRRLRRIVQQVKGELSPIKLAEDIEHWFREQNQFYPRKASKRISVQWAMDYYSAAAGKK